MTSDQKQARLCYQSSVPPLNLGAANQESRQKLRGDSGVNKMTNREEDNSPKEKKNLKEAVPHEEVECVPFSEKDPNKNFRVGTNLEFVDVFAWGMEDMPGVNPDVALHRLHVGPMFHPIKQRKRTFSEEKNLAIREEIYVDDVGNQ
ncbi:hypothetical protein LIER_42485 [Lithospermum erythrorhizon]|uniref:Uncharacterized protein n=1 Tax=Lithospermum erythrorhizon TaxID=34254 RepID=A0AAV3RU35_LITER